MGLGLVPSIFITQILTEFIYKMMIVLLVINIIKAMTNNFKLESNV